MNVRTLVSLDTESGIIRRYSENAIPTHEAGLTSSPDDADATRRVLEGFRAHPHSDFRLYGPRIRTYDDAVAEQIRRREAREAQQPLLLTHRDEA